MVGSCCFSLRGLLAGTAEDAETGVAYVQVKIDGGAWHTASYNSTTHAWTYTWNNPSSTRIWVQAMDFAGHLAEIHQDVTVSAPVVIYVSKTGNNNNNGWTWATAKLTIQAALNTAWAEGETEVWVAQGTYTERLWINHSIDLYGGFEGDETSLDQRPTFPRPDQDPHETTLDGYSGYTVIATGTGTSMVHGFTITDGNPYGVDCGGSHLLTLDSDKITGNKLGISFEFTSAPSPVASVVQRCDISDNDGTGIECSTKSAAVIEDNHIDHNVLVPSTFGAGIRCVNGGSPTIQRNWIEYNNLLGEGPGGNDGGGIWCNGGQPTIRNNVIKGNRARKGGAVFVTGISTVTMTNNTIVDNVASQYGGVVFIYQSYVTMANNILYANNTGVYRSDTAGSVALNKNCSSNLQSDYYGYSMDSSADFVRDPGLSTDRVHLAAGSFCIDKSYSVQCVGPTDIFGSNRWLDGDGNGTAFGDIGAHEFVR